jgi:hypothetical protein
MNARPVRAASVLPLLIFVSVAFGQWSDDPAVNLVIADRAGTQTLPLIGSTSDGGTYIAWFDGTDGNLDVYLQRLDAAGVEQWPHDGILISDHPQNSALFGWDMIVDSADHAVLVFSDERGGGDLDIQAYRIDPAGGFVWGADGITLSDNPDFEPAPRVTQASDGDLVFVWGRSGANAEIQMQRVSPAGVLDFPGGAISVVSETGETPGFVEIAAADSGSVILSWVRDITSFPSPRHVRARKFASNGAPLWATHVNVYDAFSVPIGYYPQILSDGGGGALFLWHRSDGAFFNSFVQHLSAGGTELLPHNGVAVSTTPGMHHLNPAFSYHQASGETIVFWNEKNSLQSQFGLYAQKLSAGGTRMWGDGGVVLLPVTPLELFPPHSVGYGDGAMVFFLDTPGVTSNRVLGMRVATDGASVWGPSPLVLSSVLSDKSRYPVTIDAGGVAKVVWEDDRSGNVDLYAQNVNPDGSLGSPAVPGSIDGMMTMSKSVFSSRLLLYWPESCSHGAENYAIYEGQVGDYYSHEKKDCSDNGGNLFEEISPGVGDTYYLIVPLTASQEGSYGTNSNGSERPPADAGNVCLASQSLEPCPE